MFYVYEVIGSVDWLDRGLTYMWEEFRHVYLLMTKFDCPEVTLCGWQDIKIQLLLLLLFFKLMKDGLLKLFAQIMFSVICFEAGGDD